MKLFPTGYKAIPPLRGAENSVGHRLAAIGDGIKKLVREIETLQRGEYLYDSARIMDADTDTLQQTDHLQQRQQTLQEQEKKFLELCGEMGIAAEQAQVQLENVKSEALQPQLAARSQNL